MVAVIIGMAIIFLGIIAIILASCMEYLPWLFDRKVVYYEIHI